MNGTRTGSTAVAAAAAAARREGNPGRRGRGRQEPATQARRGSWSDGCGEEDAAAAAAARTSSSMARRGAPSAANGHGEGRVRRERTRRPGGEGEQSCALGFGCRAASPRRRNGGVVAAVTAWRDARPFAKGERGRARGRDGSDPLPAAWRAAARGLAVLPWLRSHASRFLARLPVACRHMRSAFSCEISKRHIRSRIGG